MNGAGLIDQHTPPPVRCTGIVLLPYGDEWWYGQRFNFVTHALRPLHTAVHRDHGAGWGIPGMIYGANDDMVTGASVSFWPQSDREVRLECKTDPGFLSVCAQAVTPQLLLDAILEPPG